MKDARSGTNVHAIIKHFIIREETASLGLWSERSFLKDFWYSYQVGMALLKVNDMKWFCRYKTESDTTTYGKHAHLINTGSKMRQIQASFVGYIALPSYLTGYRVL